MKLRLYHYWRSSSSWRVRWTLAIKNLPCEFISINLLSDESDSEEHKRKNPLGYVPVLEVQSPDPRFHFLSESMAIIEWIEERHPNPPLLSRDSFERARIRQLAEIINSGTQPLQNLPVFQLHSADEAEQKKWSQHWIRKGLEAYEALVQTTAGKYSMGDTLTLADIFLVPQCYNAARFDVSLESYPIIKQIYSEALLLPSCQSSLPEKFKP